MNDGGSDAYTIPWLQRLPIARGRPILTIVAMLALVGLALALRVVADPGLPQGFPYVTFFPAVILCAFLFGTRIGALAGLLCGLLAWYFFIGEPRAFTLSSATGVALGFYALVIGTDLLIIHWLQRANSGLAREREVSAALAKTRELLFHELQHRVSNNLQVAAGLLVLQKRRVTDAQARGALDEASRRLALIGRISRRLYDAAGATRSISAFLEPLCADVIDASGHGNIRYTVRADADALLAPDAAIPLALIVAEAVANAIEHGFAGREGGTIDVELVRDGASMLRVEVRDDGHGVPEGFDIESSDSLGLRIATTLAAQLDGRFELVRRDDGTTARLTLPG